MEVNKRKAPDGDFDNVDQLDVDEIDEILEQAPKVDALDEAGLKKLVLSFEKKISENQRMRIKYPNDPSKFMDSEIELDEEIQTLHQVAAAPELFALFVQLGAVDSLLQLGLHENADIAMDVIDVLKELTEPDSYYESETASVLLDALIEKGMHDIVIQSLSRWDEHEADDRQAVHSSLAILENLVEIKGEEVSTLLYATSPLASWLNKRLLKKPLDENSVYASEILAILLQTSSANQKAFLNETVDKMNAIELLLTILAGFKRKEPSLEEEEFMQNVFDSLCSVLAHERAAQSHMRLAEGLELMLILIRAKRRLASASARKVLVFALQKHPENCQHFIEILGLKTLFAAFMKKGLSNKRKKEDLEEEEHILSLIHSVLRYANPDNQQLDRVLHKFVENHCEKVDRLVELHEQYVTRVEEALQEMPPFEDEDDDEEDEAKLSDEDKLFRVYTYKLEQGLFSLQLCDLILVQIATQKQFPEIRTRLSELLHRKNIAAAEITGVLQEYVANFGAEDDAEAVQERARVTQTLQQFEREFHD